MAQLDPRKYPFQGTQDIRTAMATALSAALKNLSFTFPAKTQPFQLTDVLTTWADFQQRARSAGGPIPIGAVLPERGQDVDSQFVPVAMEDTWDGQNVGGGFVLYKVCEYECRFTVLVRARTDPERQAIARGIEAAFQEIALDGVRYGVILEMPTYFNRKVRFTLVEQEVVANEAVAEEMRWVHWFLFEGQAPKVVPQYAPSFQPRVKSVVNGSPDNR